MKKLEIPQDNFTFEIVEQNGDKRAKINATDYYRHFLKTKTKIGDVGTMILKIKKPSRSESQLRYYWIVVGLLADHCGYTSEEMHDALMSLKWGTKVIKLGDKMVSVRKSISNSAKFPKSKMIEQIEFALEKCFEENVLIPSAESLGYTNNNKPY